MTNLFSTNVVRIFVFEFEFALNPQVLFGRILLFDLKNYENHNNSLVIEIAIIHLQQN